MKYIIKDADGNVTNTINADADFVEANFEHYELYVVPTPPEPTAEEEGRMWRDSELASTDEAAKIPDWPNRANILVYRQDLRDWPSTQDFPDTKPALGE
tara:strand:+ start:49 stop:345 length:297 start_codon:yes stop_codon:yes gene_type:complete